MNKSFYVKKHQESEIEKAKLNRQIDFLLEEMIGLSQSLGIKPSWATDNTKHEASMAHKAGLAIKKLHEMRKT